MSGGVVTAVIRKRSFLPGHRHSGAKCCLRATKEGARVTPTISNSAAKINVSNKQMSLSQLLELFSVKMLLFSKN